MSDDGSHIIHKPIDFFTTFIQPQTHTVVRSSTTHVSYTTHGTVGPSTFTGPLKCYSVPLRSLWSRRGKGTPFVAGLQPAGGSAVPNMLCLKCRSIVLSSRLLNGQSDKVRISTTHVDSLQLTERLEIFRHYSTYEELENSCAAQCHLCHLLWDILDDEKSNQVEEGSRATGSPVVVQVRTTTDESNEVQINVALQRLVHRRIEDNYHRCIIVRQYPLEAEDDKAERPSEIILLKTEHPAQLATSTASDATFDLANQWMTTCLQTHQVCQDASSETIMLPSRLIWLGASKLRLRPRLCLTTDLNTVPPYFTLSHCWGEARVTRLTRQVHREFSKAIPLDGLPKTFRDAMIITKRLGYSYIWIDSLCIIQDSAEDRRSESAIMGQIYRNSTCNLSALGAADSNGGCFVERNPLLSRPCRLRQTDQGGLYAFGYGDPKEHNEGSSELSTRAWVFQERMLSPELILWQHRYFVGMCFLLCD